MRSALVYELRQAAPADFDFVFALNEATMRPGIGTAIIRDLIRAAHGRGVPLTLWVSALNHGAIRLYQRLGFRAVRSVDFGVKGVKIELAVAPVE